nr:hypothetical protein HmN_000571900 [Hymenolepis microstoma]
MLPVAKRANAVASAEIYQPISNQQPPQCWSVTHPEGLQSSQFTRCGLSLFSILLSKSVLPQCPVRHLGSLLLHHNMRSNSLNYTNYEKLNEPDLKITPHLIAFFIGQTAINRMLFTANFS